MTVKIYWPRWFCFYWYSSLLNMNKYVYVVLASWFPAGACLYCNVWSYYFCTLNGFSFRKYFFQTYFPFKCFNKKDFAEICNEFLCTISFLVVSCHKWLTMMGIRCKLRQKKSQNKTGVSLYYFPATSSPQFRWPQMTSVRVFFGQLVFLLLSCCFSSFFALA